MVKPWKADVLDLRPDWLSVMIGINDVWRQFDWNQLASRDCKSATKTRLVPPTKALKAIRRQ